MQDLDAEFAASANTWDRYALLVMAVKAAAGEGEPDGRGAAWRSAGQG